MKLRAVERSVTDFEVDCVAYGQTWRAYLYNISTEGCLIETPQDIVRVGDMLRFAIPGVTKIDAEVTWQKCHHAGLRFARPIHARVVEHLRFKEPGDEGRDERGMARANPR